MSLHSHQECSPLAQHNLQVKQNNVHYHTMSLKWEVHKSINLFETIRENLGQQNLISRVCKWPGYQSSPPLPLTKTLWDHYRSQLVKILLI